VTPLRVIVRTVGMSPSPAISWPGGWPPPIEGQTLNLRSGEIVHVRTVSWYPEGPDEGGDPTAQGEPYVYVVVGPRRPG
jgi:hypothetical protein